MENLNVQKFAEWYIRRYKILSKILWYISKINWYKSYQYLFQIKSLFYFLILYVIVYKNLHKYRCIFV